MEVSQREEKLCVELDAGSSSLADDYSAFIPTFTGEASALKFDMREVNYKQLPYSKLHGTTNGFKIGEAMLSKQGTQVTNFPFPQPDLFGFCDNFKSLPFMTDDSDNLCFQAITDLNIAAQTFLNPLTYTQKVLQGSSPSSSSKTVTTGNVYMLDS